METQTETLTVQRVAEIVERLYEQTETERAPRPTFDALAGALGVANTCTGNPATVAESTQYAPKAGLSFGFYYVEPGYRNETNTLARFGYVAQWRGEEYRGEVIAVASVPHDGTVRVWDATRYAATLPDGCRRLVVQTVEAAIGAVPGFHADTLAAERESAVRLSEVHSAIWAAHREMRKAADISAGGRY